MSVTLTFSSPSRVTGTDGSAGASRKWANAFDLALWLKLRYLRVKILFLKMIKLRKRLNHTNKNLVPLRGQQFCGTVKTTTTAIKTKWHNDKMASGA